MYQGRAVKREMLELGSFMIFDWNILLTVIIVILTVSVLEETFTSYICILTLIITVLRSGRESFLVSDANSKMEDGLQTNC